jgi:hypothetical protein
LHAVPLHWRLFARYPCENETYGGDKTVIDAKMIPSLPTPDGKYNVALVERYENGVPSKYHGKSVKYDGEVPVWRHVEIFGKEPQV